MTNKIHALAEKALEINRAFAEGIHTKQSAKPAGFMSPDKRIKIINILEEISKLTENNS